VKENQMESSWQESTVRALLPHIQNNYCTDGYLTWKWNPKTVRWEPIVPLTALESEIRSVYDEMSDKEVTATALELTRRLPSRKTPNVTIAR
jgi:hypothetical protein